MNNQEKQDARVVLRRTRQDYQGHERKAQDAWWEHGALMEAARSSTERAYHKRLYESARSSLWIYKRRLASIEVMWEQLDLGSK